MWNAQVDRSRQVMNDTLDCSEMFRWYSRERTLQSCFVIKGNVELNLPAMMKSAQMPCPAHAGTSGFAGISLPCSSSSFFHDKKQKKEGGRGFSIDYSKRILNEGARRERAFQVG